MKKQTTKRFFATLFAVLMVMTVMPLSLAADIFSEDIVKDEVHSAPVTPMSTYEDITYEPYTLDTTVVAPLATGMQITDPRNCYAVGYSVQLEAGMRFEAYTSELDVETDTYLYLYDADFNVLDSDDDGGGMPYSKVQYEITTTGTYYILVCTFNVGGSRGDVNFFGWQYDAVTHHDLDYSTVIDVGDTVPVSLGEGTDSMLVEINGDTRYALGYTLNLDAGEYVLITADTQDVVDAYFWLIDPSDFSIISRSDSRIEYTAGDAAETVYVIASGYSSSDVGEFNMILQAYTYVTSVIVTPSTLELEQGRAATLTAEVLPENATNTEITWTSSNTSIATVDEYGLVQAGSTLGTATIYATSADNDVEGTCVVTVVEAQPPVPGEYIYAAMFDSYTYTGGFAAFTTDNVDSPIRLTMDTSYEFLCGEYYDGVYYMFDTEFNFYSVNLTTWEKTLIAEAVELPNTEQGYGASSGAMTYDYNADKMYAVFGNNIALYSIDITTGAATEEAILDKAVYGIACSTEGELYGVSYASSGYASQLFLIEQTTGAMELLRSYPEWICWWIQPRQALCYDHNTDTLYWGYYDRNSRYLFEVDLETYDITNYGPVGAGPDGAGYMLYALFTIPIEPPTPQHIPVISVTLPETETIYTGRQAALSVTIEPENATNRRLTWESSDTSVATVDARGYVTGIAVGTATITVTSQSSGATDTCVVTVEATPAYDAGDWLFGYAMYDESGMLSDSYFATMSSDPYNAESIAFPALNIYAGEYFDGYVYAVTDEGDLYKALFEADNEDWMFEFVGYTGARTVIDMAFDYSTYTMYALADINDTPTLCTMDLLTGALTQVVPITTQSEPFTLGCTTEGDIYFLTMAGELYQVHTMVQMFFSVGYIGTTMQYIQSMAYDHNNDMMLWASYPDGLLYSIDLATAELTSLGDLGSGTMEVASLFVIPMDPPEQIIVDVTSVTLWPETATIGVEERIDLSATIQPWNASNTRVFYSSDNPEVIDVTNSGHVRGLAPGTAIVTVTTDDGGFTDTCVITVEETELPEYDGLNYAHVYSQGGLFDTPFWTAFTLDALPNDTNLGEAPIPDMYAGAYYNGRIFAYSDVGYFYSIDPITFDGDRISFTTELPDDMAFSYGDGKMYAISGTSLYTVNLTTGELTLSGYIDAPTSFATLAAGVGNTMYAMGVDGNLYTFNTQDRIATSIASYGQGLRYVQSMTYDYETGLIVWAAITDNTESNIVTIDPEEGTFTQYPAVDGFAQLTVMYNYSTPRPEMGDANGDGTVNIGDAALILRYVIELITENEINLDVADVNEDTIVNTGDAAYLLGMIMELL